LISIFDKGQALRTILPTGGGRCNLAHAEYDFKELAKNYPRGEKFLYSIFSKYSTYDTLETFKEMGISCYTQENGRIFPESNSAKDVRDIVLKKIQKANIIKEKVLDLKQSENGFNLKTDKAEYFFTHAILAIGGHAGLELVKNLNIKIINPKPALVGLNTKENFNELSGTVIKNCVCNGITDDLLFTHFGVSGPIIYTISSINAFEKMPYKLNIDLCSNLEDLQNDLNISPHKKIKNILNKYLPQKIVNYILKDIDETSKAHQINSKTRDLILKRIHNFKFH
jgi:predicted Rossmann fold flavoprotein